jgi:hypothetical protein
MLDDRAGIATLQRLRPEAFAAFGAAERQAYVAAPGDLLDLCRARIRMLLGGAAPTTGDPRLRAVADYARSDLFSDLDRLAVEFAEQYVLDVASMPDDLVTALRDRLGVEGLYAFAMGLYAIDQLERLAASAAVHPGATR